MNFALSIVPSNVTIGRSFVTLDGLGFHAGWRGRRECAWTPGMGWTHGAVPSSAEGFAATA